MLIYLLEKVQFICTVYLSYVCYSRLLYCLTPVMKLAEKECGF